MIRSFWFVLLIVFVSLGLYAQPQQRAGGRDDFAVAQEYVKWIQQAIEENRFNDASAALLRAVDFANVSSDISYLDAFMFNRASIERGKIIEKLDLAIETNRWVIYSENDALLLKTQLQIALRDYSGALSSLDRIGLSAEAAGNAEVRADIAMLRLLTLRGMIFYDSIQVLAQFRSQVLLAMDRFPRDPRPVRIFFEYALFASRSGNNNPVPSDLPESDLNLLELAIRRLPFLIEIDPELAWMASPFIRDMEDARRLLASYRSGSLSNTENFKPHLSSIPIALNFGLIDDSTAIEELFAVSGNNDFPAINKDVIIDVYKLLRSEQGRDLMTQKLFSFSGCIYNDINNDGYRDSFAFYNSGELIEFFYDRKQNNEPDLHIHKLENSSPVNAIVRLTGQDSFAVISWERYPSVEQARIGSPLSADFETYNFAPADFQYAPVIFMELGGSRRFSSFLYPVPAAQYIDLSRRSLLSFCSSINRYSREIEGAEETIYMSKGVIIQAVETLNGKQVSVTEFERGLPVIQHIDLDLDGRMETIRRFRRLPQDYIWQDLLDYRRLMESSESDWFGNGRYKSMEVYLPDGSVVYYLDVDGSGEMIRLETRNQR